ncbi:hypothetical protein CANARDRAFT_231056 [[Candida] arabinofermentans NRRL YB-2248]|uniref:U3 small nucleolar RNA-associated protein 25 n=1 Tax=[Candida] arabinofermentans NRRL YB-2248 TaxID=983967 RepID=A0A1E4T530_9ASCO|nr:hypothetical protein CANARDRAFT_231056 [[Candida] arabinofermentans NRRL YB-2248]
MPSSELRKERRRHVGDAGDKDSQHVVKKTKFGRKEMRTVTRTSRRDTPKEEDLIVEQDVESDDEEEEEAVVDKPTANDDALAYSALLTLLETDHPQEKKKKKVVQEVQQELIDVIEDDGDDDDDEEEDTITEKDMKLDDDDFNNQFDAFNLHFNDDDKIEKIIIEYNSSSVKKPKLIEKSIIDDYTKLDYRYDLKSVDKPINFNNLSSLLKYHNVKQKINEKFQEFNNKLTKLELNLINSLLSYQNINFQYLDNELIKQNYQTYYLLHSLNHIFKTRDRILNNTEKKNKVLKQIEMGLINEEPDFRDQGYTRPKILILAPTRNSAYEIIMKLIKLSNISIIDNLSKFKSQFYDDFNVDDINDKKPNDFKEFFKGNSNDFFIIGLKFTRKAIKLFSKLIESDIIIASPLGLKMHLEKNKSNDKVNCDYLSSIELTILDKSDGLIMQNWDHINTIIQNHLNAPLKNLNDLKIDFSRIRMWAINDQFKKITQIITFNKYTTPELNNLVLNSGSNSKNSINLLNGVSIYKPIINDYNNEINKFKLKLIKLGLINNNVKLKQIFNRFETESIQNEPNDRFNFFKNTILQQIISKTSYNEGTLIYIPSYLDYLRVKNYMKQETKLSFVSIDEYSSQSELTKNKHFFSNYFNNAKIMLYTERLHFYKRFNLKGVKNVIFYGLPSDSSFYSEILNFIIENKIKIDLNNSKMILNDNEEDETKEEADQLDLNLCMIRIMFSKIDFIKLEKLVGLKKAGQLVNGVSEMNEFN